MRARDPIGPYGGEESVIAAPNCDVASAGLLAERPREGIGALPFVGLSNNLTVTCSVGVAMTDKSGSFDSLIHVAAAALYPSTHRGRNRVSRLPESPVPSGPSVVRC